MGRVAALVAEASPVLAASLGAGAELDAAGPAVAGALSQLAGTTLFLRCGRFAVTERVWLAGAFAAPAGAGCGEGGVVWVDGAVVSGVAVV